MQKKQQTPPQRRTRLKRTLARVTASAILIIWLNACTSTRKSNTPAPRVYPPDPYNENDELVISFVYEGDTFEASEDGVFLPYWYWEKIFDYIVDTQAAQDIYTNDDKK